MNYKKIYIWVPLIVAVTFIAGVVAGGFMSRVKGRSETEQKLAHILDIIRNDYVDEVNVDSLIEATIPNLLAGLDPHSVYIPAADLQAVNEDLDGSFSGVGISFNVENDTVVVIEVISGGPAEKVGVMAGDRIVSIDGRPFTGAHIDADSVRANLRGALGSKVTVGLRRAGAAKELTREIVRGDIPVTSIDASYIIADGMGYVKVNKFGRQTYNEFFQSLMQLKRDGAKDFVIDLRGNSGGYMDVAVMMANEFLSSGSMIVYTRGRDGKNVEYITADGTGTFQDADITVLIDEFSASSSEIFAGAMQDNDRGVIIGRRSFGKGLIQTQMSLPDSSALRLTIARYYTPSGRSIQKDYSDATSYNNDLFERFEHGEALSVDSIKLNKSLIFKTVGGRDVYGGGGIMPDIFVPNDTAGVNNYYRKVFNAGLLNRFAFKFCDENRATLTKAKNVTELMKLMPSDWQLINRFADFAAKNGVPSQWSYINQSYTRIVTQLKALIARDILGIPGYYEISNTTDPTVDRAVVTIQNGCEVLSVPTPVAEE